MLVVHVKNEVLRKKKRVRIFIRTLYSALLSLAPPSLCIPVGFP